MPGLKLPFLLEVAKDGLGLIKSCRHRLKDEPLRRLKRPAAVPKTPLGQPWPRSVAALVGTCLAVGGDFVSF
jgi:hypothetical protein